MGFLVLKFVVLCIIMWVTIIALLIGLAILAFAKLSDIFFQAKPLPPPANAVYKEEEYVFDTEIVVDLNSCTIIDRGFYLEKIEEYSSQRVDIFDSKMYGPPDKELVKCCYVVYQTEYNGKKVKFTSDGVAKDKITLSFLLDKQKQTTIRLNSANPKQYYFDLGFLEG